MSTELQSGMVRWKLWKSSCGYLMDVGFGRCEVKGWKAQARVGEDVGLGSGSGRWTLGEGQAGYGGDGVDYKGEWKATTGFWFSRD